MVAEKGWAGTLREEIAKIEEKSGASRIAVAAYDYQSGEQFQYRSEEWFHAASTIKIPILLGVFASLDGKDLVLQSRVHVRNRFQSAADGTLFRVESGRDANSEVHQATGKSMTLGDLAYHMITTSSNLATNLLVDAVGLERLQERLSFLGLRGVELRRGVEDERAFQSGINNRVTAGGLLRTLRLIEDKEVLPSEQCEQMLEILHAQQFRSGIPAGLPEEARVANKTGEISTVAHDAGLVYLPGRKPYALVVLTEWEAERTSRRRDTLARVSRRVYQHRKERQR